MTDLVGFSKKGYGGPGPETYENFFVPYIGRPIATDLIDAARLQRGERVLDVGCGTAIVARLARQLTGEARLVALDPNPGMLEFAGKVAGDLEIEWHLSNAESIPLQDGSIDVVLSQMALQFVSDKPAAVGEIARVLVPDGRVVLNVVGPRPEAFGILSAALAAHISPDSSAFVDVVFCLHHPDEIKKLVEGAGLRDVTVKSSIKILQLPAPQDFLWAYINSTPLFAVVDKAGEEARSALEKDVVEKWQAHCKDGALTVPVPVVIVTAKK